MFSLSKKHICRKCGTNKAPYLKRRGSLALEIFLYLFMIIPGVIYTLFRFTKIEKSCSKCGSEDVVESSTPVGQRLISEQK